MSQCSKCGADPSKPWLGNRQPVCNASPVRARQPMWACSFGKVAFDEYHAGHEHEEAVNGYGRCLI